MIIFKKIFKKIIFSTMFLSWVFCQDPIISVWYIGTRVSGGGPYNHYIELYNPTEEIINLGQYALIKGHGQSNNLEGQAMWGNTLNNSGVSFLRLSSDVVLFPGQTYGITRDVSHESLQNHADLVLEDECVLSISGDDAVGLFKGEGSMDDVLFATDSIPIDCIGTPYNDPGASWQVSGETGPPNSTGLTGYGVTRFAILTRKQEVCYGNAGNWDASRGCVTDSCTNWLTDTPQTSYEESEWNVYACYYPDIDGNTGPGYEPETNPNCDEDILVMEGFLNTCDLSENQPPISNAGLDQTVSYSQVVTLDGSQSTDEDGQIVSFLWEQISGTSVVLNSADQITTTFIAPAEDNILVFSLAVFDEFSGFDFDTVSVVVQGTTALIDEGIISNKIKLIGNYPNPFNPNTKIMFSVYKKSNIVISIYNIYGQKVWHQILADVEKGSHSVMWSGKTNKNKSLVSGVYIYHIISDGYSTAGKMSLLK